MAQAKKAAPVATKYRTLTEVCITSDDAPERVIPSGTIVTDLSPAAIGSLLDSGGIEPVEKGGR